MDVSFYEGGGSENDTRDGLVPKKVRFRDKEDILGGNMQVDLPTLPETSWKYMLLGNSSLVLGNSLVEDDEIDLLERDIKKSVRALERFFVQPKALKPTSGIKCNHLVHLTMEHVECIILVKDGGLNPVKHTTVIFKENKNPSPNEQLKGISVLGLDRISARFSGRSLGRKDGNGRSGRKLNKIIHDQENRFLKHPVARMSFIGFSALHG
ncbi:hypothetical protein J1N35_014963 [Gossypium stocksii]|uniref:Uncharacterized protein n=1 Tax=Gossypium stocksii TaxID=47602 RepID=A0A9D3VV79_9ROSI|nr:hypothetical protein J1N35_014963 [Gossypium stocksii]